MPLLRVDPVRLTLVAIIALAAAVRIWGLGFGLPHRDARPDEATLAQLALNVLAGDPNPHFFQWPSLFVYVLAGLVAVCFAFDGAAIAQAWREDPTLVFMAARGLSVALGIATVPVTYWIAREAAGRAAGLVAALYLSFAFLHARDSHFGVADVGLTFFTTASIAVLVRAATRVRGYRPLMTAAGLLAGLAASSKYNGALLLAPAATTHLLHVAGEAQSPRAAPARLRAAVLDPGLLLFVAALAAAFLAGTPYALLDRERFTFDVVDQATHLREAHSGIELGPGWIYHARFSLWFGLGWPLLAAAVAGLAILPRLDRRVGAVVVTFALTYYAVAGSGHTVFARYMDPVVPMACVLAAASTTRVATWLGGASHLGRLRPVLGLSALAIVAPTALETIRFDRLIANTDSRVVAADWLKTRLTAGDSVYMSGYQSGQPQVWVPYEAWTYDSVRARFEAGGVARDGLPRWIVVQESALRHYSALPPRVRSLLDRHYDLITEFRVVDPRDRRHHYDQQDAWYVPFAGFHDIERPGPNVSIYKSRTAE